MITVIEVGIAFLVAQSIFVGMLIYMLRRMEGINDLDDRNTVQSNAVQDWDEDD